MYSSLAAHQPKMSFSKGKGGHGRPGSPPPRYAPNTISEINLSAFWNNLHNLQGQLSVINHQVLFVVQDLSRPG